MNGNALLAARVKLARLTQNKDDAEALLRATHEAIQLNEGNCMRAAARARNAQVRELDEEAKAAEQQLEALRDEHERLVQQRNTRAAASANAAQLVARIESWMDRLRPAQSLRACPSRVKEYSAQTLERKRNDIRDFGSDLQSAIAAPLDRKSLEDAIKQRVAALAASCKVQLTGERDGPLDVTLDATERGLHRPFALELLAWINPQALTARLLVAIPEPVDGMTPQNKALAIERLSAELLSAERAEEALIEAAYAAGIAIERRIDADPRAVLGVEVVAVAASAAA